MATLGSVVGGVVVLAKWFYSYLNKTNQERAEEIKSSVTVQTELKGVIKHNNYLVEQLPDRIEDKLKAVMIDERIQAAMQSQREQG